MMNIKKEQIELSIKIATDCLHVASATLDNEKRKFYLEQGILFCNKSLDLIKEIEK